MKTDELAIEILKDLRADKSLEWLAMRMGATKAQVYRWEKGENKIRWDKFCHLCKVRNREIPDSYYSKDGRRINYRDVTTFIQILYEIIGEKRLSSELDLSRHTLQRWTRGESMPSLNQMLSLIRCSGSFMLINFVKYTSNSGKSVLIQEWMDKCTKELDLTYDYPEIAALLRCLELKSYQDLYEHKTGFIAEKLNISHEFEKLLLELSVQHGIITFDGSKYFSHHGAIDTAGEFQKNVSIKRYWLERAVSFTDNLEKPPTKSLFAHNVFGVSTEGQKKVIDLYHKFYEEVRDVISQDSAPTEVFVLGIQLFCPSKEEMLSGEGF